MGVRIAARPSADRGEMGDNQTQMALRQYAGTQVASGVDVLRVDARGVS